MSETVKEKYVRELQREAREARVGATNINRQLSEIAHQHLYTIHATMPLSTTAQLIDELQTALAQARSWLEKNQS
jgi:hypothetical protein